VGLGPGAVDALVLAWLALCWLAYPRLVALLARRRAPIDANMRAVRRAWMDGVLRRDFRVPDTMLMGQVIQSVSFFASGTIIVVGALVGALAQLGGGGGPDALPGGLAPGGGAPSGSLRVGLLALLAIFVFAFFKFTWTLRQYNYCLSMIGAAPLPPLDPGRHARLADALARGLSEASLNFNIGLRCYYFAFAALAWFVHPLLVPAATVLTMAMLLRRQFRSGIAASIADALAELDPPSGRPAAPNRPRPPLL
jgi:uncharacterized membrane protein